MSAKGDYNIRRWQCLIKECQESGMKVKDWCSANDISKDQYYYWLSKVRSKCYEAAVNQLQPAKAVNNIAVPVQVQEGSFVEIKPELVSEAPERENLSQPVAIVQKGSIRIEIMSKAPTSLIKQLLETVCYA